MRRQMRLHVRSSRTVYSRAVEEALSAAPASVVGSHGSGHSVLMHSSVS